MARPLNITDAERQGCTVTFNVNRYEVYSKAGAMYGALQGKAELKAFIAQFGLVSPMLDGIATRMYMAGR